LPSKADRAAGIAATATCDYKRFSENIFQINPKEIQMSKPNLLDAIRVVKENERLATEFYANAAKSTGNPMGRELFVQLSEFEKSHYERLTALEKSLQEKGNFINYAGKAFPLPPKIGPKTAEEPNQQTVMKIISEAIELEKKAEKAYADIAAEITDPQGHEMFNKLSREEYNHYCILTEAYWNLTNFKVWKWTQA
jgi:rubrerythrin